MTTYLTDYLLKWGLSSLILLGIYKLVLENQPMHHLKRAYLLATLLVPLAIPLVTINVPATTLPFSAAQWPVEKPVLLPAAIFLERKPEPAAPAVYVADRQKRVPLTTLLYGLYGAVTLLLLGRLGRNLYQLSRQVRRHPVQSLGRATLVRLPGNGLPYTFLHYLFVSDAAYCRGEVEPELLTHELAHIRQRHSVDVLLVELVLCVGWFNPLLIILKRAIQLNHEFLADASVNTTYRNVIGYQRLLLSKLTPVALSPALTSTLTFQTTKQRLLMMTKQNSPARQWLATAGTVLLFGTLTFAMTAQTVAQQTPAPTQPVAQPTATAPPFGRALTPDEMDRWFADKKVAVLENGSRNVSRVLYRDLTPDQKKRVVHLVTEPRKQPTEAEWKELHNTKKYGLWVDGKRRRDKPLDTQYKRTDIVYFWSSYVHKNARQPEGYLYQLELYTEPAYQKMLKNDLEHPSLFLRETKPSPPKTTR